MTVEQLSNAIIKNIKNMKQIGAEKLRGGTANELLQMRAKAFHDVLDWYGRGCANRKKSEMELLFKRSEHMIKVFNRV